MGAIKICNSCNGEGEKWEAGYRGDGEMVKCDECKGSGKIYVRMYGLQIAFPDKNDKDYHDLDSLVINKIRDLQQKLKNKV